MNRTTLLRNIALCFALILPAPALGYDGPMTLAITWQPAFCEGRSKVPECRSQRAGRFDTQNFTLHGLWPGPRGVEYCGVSSEERRLDERRQWRRLPGLGLSQEIRERLYEAMPGVRSGLHRHEWVKHGSCYGRGGRDGYFEDSLALLDQINKSSVRELFARSVGRNINARAVRDAINRDFGPAVAQRVELKCRRDGRRQLITELRFYLQGPVSDTPRLERLASRGRKAGRGCGGGIVDPVGLQ